MRLASLSIIKYGLSRVEACMGPDIVTDLVALVVGEKPEFVA